MPSGPWPPPPCGADFFSGISQIMASVVSIRALIEELFWRAVRVTLAGSMPPGLLNLIADGAADPTAWQNWWATKR